ncbi:hypothetical protein NOJ05_06740 [Neorhizobium galegae]|uniref:hypothetical protein n=1 Tax=Neorhizobium galegae TaxID=399 RepID=UPI000A7E3B8C|nr:hypothetical protein [Neorhizobium galegae]MCQ1776891.1 hypothetical protein [Neorhizobium galegae]MCQ1793644.1 hypothetical protein [Neorhizobium galegae]
MSGKRKDAASNAWARSADRLGFNASSKEPFETAFFAGASSPFRLPGTGEIATLFL